MVFLSLMSRLCCSQSPLKGQKQMWLPWVSSHSALPACPLEVRLPSSSGPQLLGTVKAAACHRLLQSFSSSKPVLPAGPLGTSRHGDVVAMSPGSQPSWASLWAGLGQGLRGSLCPWYKSATMASQPRLRRALQLRRPAGPGRALPRRCAGPGSGGTAPRGSCPAAGPRQ